MKRVDEQGPHALVQVPRPVNCFPEFVAHIVQSLRALCPTMGRRRIADTLARAGLHISASTARRMLDKDPTPMPEAPGSVPAPARTTPSAPSRTVTARYPHHVWNIDLTVMPTAAGMWIPMFPGSLLQRWPFAWWVAVVVDHFSRSVVGFEVFRSQPSANEMCVALDRIVTNTGRAPKYTVTDKGTQFRDAFRAWCDMGTDRVYLSGVDGEGVVTAAPTEIYAAENALLSYAGPSITVGQGRESIAVWDMNRGVVVQRLQNSVASESLIAADATGAAVIAGLDDGSAGVAYGREEWEATNPLSTELAFALLGDHGVTAGPSDVNVAPAGQGCLEGYTIASTGDGFGLLWAEGCTAGRAIYFSRVTRTHNRKRKRGGPPSASSWGAAKAAAWSMAGLGDFERTREQRGSGGSVRWWVRWRVDSP